MLSLKTDKINFEFFLDVAFDIDDIIDINELRGYGIQPGEEELPDLIDERQNGNHPWYMVPFSIL